MLEREFQIRSVEGLVITMTREKKLLKKYFSRKRKIDHSVLLPQSSTEMECPAKQSHALYFRNNNSCPCCGADPLHPA